MFIRSRKEADGSITARHAGGWFRAGPGFSVEVLLLQRVSQMKLHQSFRFYSISKQPLYQHGAGTAASHSFLQLMEATDERCEASTHTEV